MLRTIYFLLTAQKGPAWFEAGQGLSAMKKKKGLYLSSSTMAWVRWRGLSASMFFFSAM